MHTPSPIPSFVRQELEALNLELTDAELASLSQYLDLLYQANERMNLTAIRDRDEAWRLHIIDSLTLLPFLTHLQEGGMTPDTSADDASGAGAVSGGVKRLIDVGSGGGLPGIPVAITQPGLQVTLLEATGKKARFLEETVAALGLADRVKVVNLRAEEAGQDAKYRQRFDVAICRAVGPMRVLLEITLPLVRVDGVLLAMKGQRIEDELAQAGEALASLGAGEVQVFDAFPEGADRHTVVACIAKDRSTPRMYPRRPGIPKQDPL